MSNCPHCNKPLDTQLDLTDRTKSFAEKIAQNKKDYPRDMLKEFYDYWTEKSDNGRKMRFEKEKVFQVSRRLTTWNNRRKVKHESFQERDDRNLRESFERTANLRQGRLQTVPVQGGNPEIVDKQKQVDWSNYVDVSNGPIDGDLGELPE